MFIKKISVLVLTILLFSCADPSIFEGDSDEIAIYTVRSGGLQEYGTPLNITLDYGRESPEFDILEVSIFSDAGIKLQTETFSAASIESKKSIKLDISKEMLKGLYHIKLRLLKSGITVKEETRSFFYGSDLYSLEGVISYPPDPVPGDKITLKADFSSPPESDPYFRWTVDEAVVSEGFASEHGNIATLDSLSSDGVVPVFVEMLPFKPSGNSFGEFVSFYNSETAVFVSEKNRERNNEFADNKNFSMLFHFRGEILDEGFEVRRNPEYRNIEVTGNPDLDFKNSLYGYLFSREDFMTVPYIALPFQYGNLAPSTFRIRMLPYTGNVLPGDEIIDSFPVFAAGNNSDFSLEIGIKGINSFFINLESDSRTFTGFCEYALKRGNEIIDLSVNFYPGMNSTGIVWIVNGETVKSEKIPFSVTAGSISGFSRIGGSDILVDEAGVYARNDEGQNSVDSTLYSRFMEIKYNGDFIAASGFDESGMSSYSSETGSVRCKNGLLILGFKSSVTVFKSIELYDSVEIKAGGSAVLQIKDKSGNTVLESGISENESVYFDPSEYGDNRIFDINLANLTTNEVYEIDNILIIRKYSE